MNHCKYSMIIFFFFLLKAFAICTTNPSQIIQETCEKCASTDPNVNLTLCIDSFNSIPKAHNANLKGLGVIAIKISRSNASVIKRKIKRSLKDKELAKSPYLKSCLETCLELYASVVADLKSSSRAVKSGRYDDANILLSSVIDAPDTCEDGFKDGDVKSPLEKENHEFLSHSVIALSIVALLQGIVGA